LFFELFLFIEVCGHSVVLWIQQSVIDDEGQWHHIEDIFLDEAVVLSEAVEHCLFVPQQAIARHVVVDDIGL
jgi:hypothetical protein